jgi:tRNA threonylcarbamoyladenosine biosynthesis protein TsaB
MEFYMLVLALDTTTRRGSVALVRDGGLLECYSGDAAVTHGQRLPGDLMHVLDRQRLSVEQIDLFAVAAGPGSFTGLRIGIAAMQGLAFAGNRSLIGVSALDALNEAVRALSPEPLALSPSSEVAVWMDAQRGEVFSALYAGDRVMDGPSVEKPERVLARWGHSRIAPPVFAGDGARAYEEMIRTRIPAARVLQEMPPLAPSVAALAESRSRREGRIAPESIRPIYIRRPDAELARDRAKNVGEAQP